MTPERAVRHEEHEDRRRQRPQERGISRGETDDRQSLHITFILRAAGTSIRVISARDMHRKERMTYGQATQVTA